jgi:uncharacterized iron-regulated membrane protein
MHRWGAILIAVPTLLVILTGLLLQLKKEVAWIQPPTAKGSSQSLQIDWEQILDATVKDPRSGVTSWDDINRLDVRPKKGIVKVRCNNGWEIQLDTADGSVLSSAYRRSDLIESLHDGSFFSDNAKLYLFFANGLILFGLWLTGMYLWYLPIQSRRTKKKRIAMKSNQPT